MDIKVTKRSNENCSNSSFMVDSLIFLTFCQCNWSFWIINMKIGNLTIIYFWGHSLVNSLCKTLFCKCPVEWSVVIVNMNYNFYSAQTRSPWVVNSISCPVLQLIQLHQARTEYQNQSALQMIIKNLNLSINSVFRILINRKI